MEQELTIQRFTLRKPLGETDVASSDDLFNEAVAERLRLTRVALGYSQSFMARLVRLVPGTWNQYEQAVNRIPVPTAIRVCIVAGCDLNWIYRGETLNNSQAFNAKLNKVLRKKR